jgi:hypothetical protein
MTSIGEEDARHNKLDYLLLSKQVDALCSQVGDCGISPPVIELPADE